MADDETPATDFPQADRVPPMRMILISVAVSLLIVSVLFSVLSPRGQPIAKDGARTVSALPAKDTSPAPDSGASRDSMGPAGSPAESGGPTAAPADGGDKEATTASSADPPQPGGSTSDADDASATEAGTPVVATRAATSGHDARPQRLARASSDSGRTGTTAAQRQGRGGNTHVATAAAPGKTTPVAAKSLDELLK